MGVHYGRDRAEGGLTRMPKTLPLAISLKLWLYHRAVINPGCEDNQR